MAAQRQGAQTVLTGLLDRSALYGVLADIDALGLDLIELRHPGQPDRKVLIMSDAAHSIASSGRFALGRWQVHRVGFGAMQLAGANSLVETIYSQVRTLRSAYAAAALPTVIRRLAIACLVVVMGLLAILWGATPDYGDVASQTAQTSDSVAPTCAPGASGEQCGAQP